MPTVQFMDCCNQWEHYTI